ncbi:MAG: lipid-A-disaccharide synthase N-terminal domain-containing protein [Marinilabiliales bacterium]|nr:lipid-A-disaccharide synthase N-terminal domain-containing protein [Marinilabiliales bacterium]
MNEALVYLIGFFAQLLFMSRMIVQWVRSEKAGRSLSPTLFWEMSLLGSIFFFLYGILRKDFAIVLGQSIVYFIYLRNLYFKKIWSKIHLFYRILFILLPFVATGWFLSSGSGNWHDLLDNREISVALRWWGSLGQVVFTLRFVVQWVESERKRESLLTVSFWLISLIGSLMILSYAVVRRDPVLLIGQLSGAIIYSRNLVLIRRSGNQPKYHPDEPFQP